ncbi:MAG: hypothetical protein GC190_05635 [Alphaproteobacteria bacterium]|nr:hypothetical protein [Alphaproteobacteria bacterium]
MRRLLLVFAVVFVAGAGLLFWQFDRAVEFLFQYPPPKADETKPASEADGRQRDALYFSAFTRYDRSYSSEARRQAEKLSAALIRDAHGLTRAQFILRVAQIAALANNGHTQISSAAFAKGVVALPLELNWFKEGLFILRTKADRAALLGARIDAIDGRPTEEVFVAAKKYVGGTDEHRRMLLTRFMRSPELLHAAGLADDSNALTLRGVRADGTAFEERIAGEALALDAPYVPNVARLLYPTVVKGDGKLGWLSFIKADRNLPLYLQSALRLFVTAPLEGSGLYIGIAYNADGDEEKIGPFLHDAEQKIRTQKPAYIVVDMRMNGGGDYTTTYDFASRLPAIAPSARIYVLTSNYTFSAAITTTAFIKQAGGNRVMIVGAPVGDRLTFWAEGGHFFLPNVQVGVNYAAGMHDYAHACWNPFACFWLNYFYPVRVDTLEPDIAAPLTFADYRALRDPALEAVLAHEKAAGNAAALP